MFTGQLYGLEKFWAFLKYSKAKTMEIDPKLQQYLSKFKRLEDFRIDVSRIFLVKAKVLEVVPPASLFSVNFRSLAEVIELIDNPNCGLNSTRWSLIVTDSDICFHVCSIKQQAATYMHFTTQQHVFDCERFES